MLNSSPSPLWTCLFDRLAPPMASYVSASITWPLIPPSTSWITWSKLYKNSRGAKLNWIVPKDLADLIPCFFLSFSLPYPHKKLHPVMTEIYSLRRYFVRVNQFCAWNLKRCQHRSPASLIHVLLPGVGMAKSKWKRVAYIIVFILYDVPFAILNICMMFV